MIALKTTHRFTVEDYYRMAETGVLRPDARVELIEGQILDMSPIGPFHGGVTNRLARLFIKLAQDRWYVSIQTPLRLDEHSEPQPDMMLLKPDPGDYTSHHPEPSDVFLLIEVADTSVGYDRNDKLPAYGRAGIREVWLVNLVESVVEVFGQPHFTGYGTHTLLRAGDKAHPSAFPDIAIDVATVLQKAR